MNAIRAALYLAVLLAPGCAWANRDNRPVWNAFETHCVPESQGAFVAALPLTVPAGLLAILADTFVAHPLQVVDDAADDAADLWRHLDLEQRYWTEAGWMPFRALATPLWFAGSFLGRSAFDIQTAEQQERARAERAALGRARTLGWLRALAAGQHDGPQHTPPGAFDDELRAAVATAAAQATPLGRMELYTQAARHAGLGAAVDWAQGLSDPSAVVRFHVLRHLPKAVAVPEPLRQRLVADPDEAVRAAAARRFAH